MRLQGGRTSGVKRTGGNHTPQFKGIPAGQWRVHYPERWLREGVIGGV